MKIEKKELTPELINRIRRQIGFDQYHFGELLGYGSPQIRVSELERGIRKGSPAIRKMIEMIATAEENGTFNEYLKAVGLDIWIICPKCKTRVFDYRGINWIDPSGVYKFECKCGETVEYRE